ncbi:hypothetical protein DFP73DRAFT_598431 [Morchella snyderi]|nr:hypothetical protein DFP73DRAFT_598431 [Morchella snyderi]
MLREESKFNFPKLHLMSDFTEHIRQDYIFARHGLNLLQIALDRYSTLDLVDNLEVLELHLKRRLHRATRKLANSQDHPAIRLKLIAPLRCFSKEEPVE